MRNYGSKYVRRRLLVGRADAVCPFPGKHPLRLVWRVTSKNVPALNAFHYGKFTTASWKRFVALAEEARMQDVWAIYSFTLFDRNGMLANGSPHERQMISALHKTRYFPFEGRVVLDYLATAEPRRCGRYVVYGTEPFTEQEAALNIRNIETVVPTLRNR